MKKVILFALILSVSGLIAIGCSGGGEEGADNSVNKESTVKADFNKPAATDNPGGQKPNTPL